VSDIAVTVTNPGSAAVTIGAGGSVSATVSSGGSVAVNLPGGEAAWTNITGKPTTFTPATHTHLAADITDRATALVTSVNGQTGAVTVSGGGGGGADLGDAVPQPLGTAAAGTSTDAAREDHVHAMPTAADVGALDSNSVIDGGNYTGYVPENTITITTQPTNQTAVDGAATFSVVATVSPVGTLSYQWQKSDNDGASWAAVSGATSSSISLSSLTNAADDGDLYRVIVSAQDATTVTSNAATLTVSPPPAASNWVQLGGDIDGEAGERFGWSVALSNSGTVMAVGATYDNAGGTQAGCVRVYHWNGTAWSQRGADLVGHAGNASAGYSVALSGDGTYVVVGSPGLANTTAVPGRARVYAWNGTAWTQRGGDIIPDPYGGFAGNSVSIDDAGEWVVIGAPYTSNQGWLSGGRYDTYQWDGSGWALSPPSILGVDENDYVGQSVAISGDGTTRAVGGTGIDFSGDDNRGAVGIYRWNGGSWSMEPSIYGSTNRSLFGSDVSLNLDGTVMAVAGGAYFSVYAKSGGTWAQRGPDITISGGLNYRVAISDSGLTLAVGSRDSDVNFTNSGLARVYDWSGSAWVQRGPNIVGEAGEDYSGRAIALSADGTIIAVGAYANDGGGTNSGHVRVFKWQ
jgi:hypothetical protein